MAGGGQETGNRIKPLWDTLSQWNGTRPLPSAGDTQAEGKRAVSRGRVAGGREEEQVKPGGERVIICELKYCNL